MAKQSPKARKMLAAMKKLARVASVMIDGEEVVRLAIGRSPHYVACPDPLYRELGDQPYDAWLLGFLRMKKALQRLETLVDFTCNTALWVKPADVEGRMALLMHNGNVHRYYVFGDVTMETPPEMAEAMADGEAAVVEGDDRLTVLAPLLDSLGDVVGVLELSAEHPSAKSIAPAHE